MHPVVIYDYSGGQHKSAYGYDGNGAMSVSIDTAEFAEELEFAATMLRKLRQNKIIIDFGIRSNVWYGYSIRVMADEHQAKELDKFEFAMCFRWPMFQHTKKTIVFVAEAAALLDDWKRIPITDMD